MTKKPCYIAVVFPGFADTLYYYADTEAAHACAAAIERSGLARVRIDQRAQRLARPLPCERLWLL